MVNEFDAAWNASFPSQVRAMGEDVTIGTHNCTCTVVEFGVSKVVGAIGGADYDLNYQIEIALTDWRKAHGTAGTPVFVRSLWLKVADEPSDSEDCGTVLLTLTAPGR